jgi:hypothetical protein
MVRWSFGCKAALEASLIANALRSLRWRLAFLCRALAMSSLKKSRKLPPVTVIDEPVEGSDAADEALAEIGIRSS